MELLLLNSEDFQKELNDLFTFQYGATATIDNRKIYLKYLTFTFQYGATATDKYAPSFPYKFKFTFQYGATATSKQIFRCSLKNYLHSNMELLLLALYSHYTYIN